MRQTREGTQTNTENHQRTTRRDRQSHCQPEGVRVRSCVYTCVLTVHASMYVRARV